MPDLTILMLVLTSIVGVVLYVFGRRGRRIDDHPVCRACRYDLSGSEQAPERCPECGAGLLFPRSMRRGNRRRLPVMVGIGVALAGLGVGVLLLTVVLPIATGAPLTEHKPLWLLRLEAMEFGSDASLNEIRRRAAAGGLTAVDVQPLITRIVEHQIDTATPWEPRFGSLWWTLVGSGLVPASQIDAYVQRMFVDTALRMRPRLRPGDPIVLQVGGTLRGLGTTDPIQSMFPTVRVRLQSVDADDLLMPLRHTGSEYSAWPAGQQWTHEFLVSPSAPFAESASGETAVHATIDLSLSTPYRAGLPWTRFEGVASFKRAAPSAELIRRVTDPGLKRQVASEIQVQRMLLYTGGRKPRLSFMISVPARDTGVAWEVWAVDRDAGREENVGRILLPALRTNFGIGQSAELPTDWRPTSVDLELRPNLKMALTHLEIDAVVDTVLHFDAVPVTHVPSASGSHRDGPRLVVHPRERDDRENRTLIDPADTTDSFSTGP